MEKAKLEKYWRCRWLVFIAFMIPEALGSYALYEKCNLWKPSSFSGPAKENSQALAPEEQLRKVMEMNKKLSERGQQ